MNPFVYNRPVSADQLIDRDAEADQLVELAEGGHASRLSGPRRYGKTSLLNRVVLEADRRGMAPVYVDLSRAVSLADVAVTIEQAYRRSLQGPMRRAAVAVIRTINPRAKVAPGGIGVELAPQLDPEAVRRLMGLLDLPLSLYQRTGRRALVIFDEFQELLQAGDRLDALVRSRIQHHGDAASYIYAGSHPGLMRELFAQRERPLYGQARPLVLRPLSDTDLADYIGQRFEESARDVGEALDPLLDFVVGHPQRAMMLAHHLWEHTPPGERAGAEEFDDALRAARAEAQDALHAIWDGLSHAERAVLAAFASGDLPLLSERTLETYGVPKSTARAALRRLLERGDLHELDNGSSGVVDPFLADFAHNRIPAVDEEE